MNLKHNNLIGLICFLLFFILNSPFSFAQNKIHGKVIHIENKEAIPFAHIVYNSAKQGVITDLDGKFNIQSRQISFLKISAIGFETKYYAIDQIKDSLIILLKPVTYTLPEAIVRPGINPAHRIIKEVVKNRSKNHPEKNRQFTSLNYDKFYYFYKTDSLMKNDSVMNGKKKKSEFTARDSSFYDFVTEMNEKYYFIKETVSKKYFKSPQKTKDVIILNRNSGFSNPATVILASELQDFSFYKPVFNILNQQFVNPVSTGSTSRYFFELKDTLYNEQGDSTFIIYFRPYKGKNFSGLQGFLHINSRNYAIENVKAENVDAKDIKIKFQQTYQLIQNEIWFPKQLFIDFSLLGFIPWRPQEWAPVLTGSGQTYIDSIQLNPDFNHVVFSELSVAFQDTFKANENFEQFKMYRPEPINEKELKSYSFVDSIGEVMHWDYLFDFTENLMYGLFPIGYLDVDLLKMMEKNEYEGTLLGLGIYTNPKLSKRFTLGGYYQYGLDDEKSKYGASLDLWFNYKRKSGLRFEISDDLPVQGYYEFLEHPSIIGKNYQRMYSQTSFYRIKELKAGLTFNPIKYLTIRGNLAFQQYFTLDDYLFNNEKLDNKPLLSYGIDLRYAFGERLTEMNRGYFSDGTRFPICSFSYHKTKSYTDNTIDRDQYLFRIEDDFSTVFTGKTKITAELGYQTGSAPLPLCFSAPGNYNPFSFISPNTFETMKPAEFFAEEFVHLFFEQDFGTLIMKNKWFQPMLIFSQNIGFGRMHSSSEHNNYTYKTYENGFYESGLHVKNMLRWKIFGLGFGAFYRYGPYMNQKIKDNLALKFSVNIIIL